MPSAFDVARCLVHLAGQGEEPDLLTHLRLQKLLYYVQGWAIAGLGRPLFGERVEAWPKGPVVKELYHQLKGYGNNVIPSGDLAEPEGLAPEESAFITSVWEKYKGYSTSALIEMTHHEVPWRDARRGLEPTDRTDAEISHEALKAWFGPKLARHSIPGLPVAAAYKAAAAVGSAPGKTHDEVFAQLRQGR